MTDATYNAYAQKCNSNPQSHVNVTDDSGALADELECFGVWLEAALKAETFAFAPLDIRVLILGSAKDLQAASRGIRRASDKEGV